MPIAPLPPKLPGQNHPGLNMVRDKVNEVIGVVNTQETQLADLTARVTTLETPEPGPGPDPSPAPVASVAVSISPSTAPVGGTAQATATARDAAGNILTDRPIAYSIAPASVASVDSHGSVNALAVGTATVMATAEGISGAAGLAVAAVEPEPGPGPGEGFAIPPEPPRSVPARLVLVANVTRRVEPGGDLQAALSASKPGDVVLMAPGSRFEGEFKLPQPPEISGDLPPCELRTDIPRTPTDAADRRMTPSKAASLKLATLNAPSTQAALTAIGDINPTRGWILSDFAITGTLKPEFLQYALLSLGNGGWRAGGDSQFEADRIPSGFWLDRLYIDGRGLNCVLGVGLNSAATVISSAWISNICAPGNDAKAICGWNGPGPFLVDDCHLAASTENIMFGGADPGIAGLSPSDITFDRCHFWKDPAWRGVQSVKNLFELKHAKRVRVRRSVLENNWPGPHGGAAIVVKSLSDGEVAPWTQSADVLFEYCVVRNCSRGFNVQGKDGVVAQQVARVRAQQMLFDQITDEGWLNLITHKPSDIALDRVTFRHAPGARGKFLVMDYGDREALRLEISNVIATNPDGYGYHYSGATSEAALKAMWAESYRVRGNVIGGIARDLLSVHPADNDYPESIAFNPDGSLPPGSPWTGKGADVAEILRQTAGVVVSG